MILSARVHDIYRSTSKYLLALTAPDPCCPQPYLHRCCVTPLDNVTVSRVEPLVRDRLHALHSVEVTVGLGFRVRIAFGWWDDYLYTVAE